LRAPYTLPRHTAEHATITADDLERVGHRYRQQAPHRIGTNLRFEAKARDRIDARAHRVMHDAPVVVRDSNQTFDRIANGLLTPFATDTKSLHVGLLRDRTLEPAVVRRQRHTNRRARKA